MAAVLTATALFAGAQEKKNPDLGPTTGLLSSTGPTFTVPKSQIPSHWTLIAYGDMRFTDPANQKATNPKVRRWLVEKIAAEHPDALLLNGDVPWHGGNAADYAVFHDETGPWREAKLRVYPALGNHELAQGGTEGVNNWWGAFPEMKGRRWYSVQFGNAYILALDSNLPLTPGSDQRQWMDEQLDNLPKGTKFVFIDLHHPPVADNGPHERHNLRPNEIALADYLNAKMAAASTSDKSSKKQPKLIVIAGHTHNYERFQIGNIAYLVSGGGGADPYPVERDSADLYQDKGFPNYHYVRFVYDGKKLNATMVRVADPATAQPAWEVKDTFTIDPDAVTPSAGK